MKLINKHTLALQKGTVLIVALFIMVLLEVTVGALVLYHRIEIRHAHQYLASQKAIQLAYGAEAAAKAIIFDYYVAGKPLNEIIVPKKTIEDAEVTLQVMDIQGHYNLNNLTETATFDAFKNMMRAISPEAGTESDNIIDFIQRTRDKDTQSGVGQLPLLSITEIRPLSKMTVKLFEQLLPHVFVLPVLVPLNVNTASAYSLMSLNPNITNDIARSIISMRENAEGFKQIEEFFALPALNDITIEADKVTVLSQFYLCRVVVNYQNVELTLYSLLRIVKAAQDYQVLVYWRSFGTL